MTMSKLCDNKTAFLEHLLQVNQQAGVAPDVLDLIESYANLRFSRNKELTFYTTNRPVAPQDKKLLEFLQKNSQVDQRALNFLIAYYREMKSSNLTCRTFGSHP